MPFTPLGYDHVVLRVRDQAVAQKFYVDVLGCRVERVNAALSLIHLRFGEQQIDLVPGEGNATAGRAGVDHICLSVHCDDIDGLAAELTAQGVVLDGPVIDRFGAYGQGRSLYLRDPDGYKVELKPR